MAPAFYFGACRGFAPYKLNHDPNFYTDSSDNVETPFYVVNRLHCHVSALACLEVAAVRCYARRLTVVVLQIQYLDGPSFSKLVVDLLYGGRERSRWS